MTEPFPFPQTLGRTRGLNTVAADPNAGLIARPTQAEAISLFTQFGNYVNNWLGNVPAANAVKDAESLAKAEKVSASGKTSSFSTIAETFTESATRMKTIADQFLESAGYKVSRVDPGAVVPGRPAAPTTTHYQYPNLIDKKVTDVKAAAEAVVDQVKGLFNIQYEGPTKPEAVTATEVGAIQPAGAYGWLVLAGLILLAVKK